MPPAAVGAAFVAMGATAATGAAVTALVTAAYIGAAVGAVVGAATALVTGGDVLKGAVKGAALGFVSGGVLKGVGIAMSAAGSAGAGVGEAGVTAAGESALQGGMGATEAAGILEGMGASSAPTVPSGGVASGATAVGLPAQTAVAPAKEGLLGRAMNWVDAHPGGASVIGQGLGGAAKGMLESRTADKEIAALMERDRLNREALQIKGLEDLDLRSPLPSIVSFADRPKWQFPETGLIWGGKQDAKA